MHEMEVVIRDAFWSAIAALGFAMLFNVPTRTLLGCALIGATGHSLRTFLLEVGEVRIELATLVSATWMGFLGYYFAQRLRTPAPILSVSGAITMVPGLFAYRTMIGLLRMAGSDASSEILLETTINGIRTALILAAIAGGITAPSLLFQRQRPIV